MVISSPLTSSPGIDPYSRLSALLEFEGDKERQKYLEGEISRIASLASGSQAYVDPLKFSLRRDFWPFGNGPLGKGREKNLVLRIPNPKNPEKFVQYVAHYDRVGGSGANDNSSGVATCLALAEDFAGEPFGEYGIEIVLSAGEEGSQSARMGMFSNGVVANLMIAGIPVPIVNIGLAGAIQKAGIFQFGLRGSRQVAERMKKDPSYSREIEASIAVDSVGVGSPVIPWSFSDGGLLGIFFPSDTDPLLNKRLSQAYSSEGEKISHMEFGLGATDAVPIGQIAKKPSTANMRLGKNSRFHTKEDSLSRIEPEGMQSNYRELLVFHESFGNEKPLPLSLENETPYSAARVFSGKDSQGLYFSGYRTDSRGNDILEVREIFPCEGGFQTGELVDWASAPPSKLRQVFPFLGKEIYLGEFKVDGKAYSGRSNRGWKEVASSSLLRRNSLGALGAILISAYVPLQAGVELSKYCEEPLIPIVAGGLLACLAGAATAKAILNNYSGIHDRLSKAAKVDSLSRWAGISESYGRANP